MAKIQFIYKDSSGKKSSREVTVFRIEDEFGERDFMLTGHCHLRDEERSFWLDSMSPDIVLVDSGKILSRQYLRRAKTTEQLWSLLRDERVDNLITKRKPATTENKPVSPSRTPDKILFTLSEADNKRLKKHSFFGDTQQPKPKKPKKTSTENTSSEPTKTQAVLFLLCIILAFFGAWDAIFMIVAFAVWFYSGIAFWRKASRKGKGFFIKCIHSFGGGFLAYLAVLLVGIFAGVIDTKPQEQSSHKSAEVTDVPQNYIEADDVPKDPLVEHSANQSSPPKIRKMPHDMVTGFIAAFGSDFLVIQKELADAKERYKYNHASYYNWQKKWLLKVDRANDGIDKLKPHLLASTNNDEEHQLISNTITAFANLRLAQVSYNSALIQIMREGDESKFKKADKLFEQYFSDYISLIKVKLPEYKQNNIVQ